MTNLVKRPEDETARSAPRLRRNWWRWGVVLIVVITVGIGAIFGARLGKDSSLVSTPLIGQQASDRSLPYLEQSGKLSLNELRGKIVVVNFWASWCVACRAEHPDLVAAAAAYRDAGVQFVGVTYQDRPENSKAYLDEMGRGEGYLNLTDPGQRLSIDFGVFGVPETFFIDQKGKIAAKITGAASFPLLASVLDEMLAGKNPNPSVTTGPVQGDESEK